MEGVWFEMPEDLVVVMSGFYQISVKYLVKKMEYFLNKTVKGELKYTVNLNTVRITVMEPRLLKVSTYDYMMVYMKNVLHI